MILIVYSALRCCVIEALDTGTTRGVHPQQSLLRRSWPWLALMASACAVESTGPTLDDVALLLAEEECASHLAGDCGEPAWPDEAACVEQRAAEIRSAYAEAEALGRRFDSACAEALTDPAPTVHCASICSVLVGDKRLGEACSDEGPGSDCGVSLLCYDGTCVESTRFAPGAVGEPCIDEAGDFLRLCRTGLYCDQTSSGTCLVGPAAGEPCIDGVQCGMGSFCDVDDGLCRPQLADGEPCSSLGECQSSTCDDGVCVAPEPFWCTNDDVVRTLGCAEPL